MDDIYLGVDPGKTTGLFIVGPEVCGWMQPTEWDAVKNFRYLFTEFKPKWVVIEKFNVHEQRTALAGTDIIWPLDVIGAIHWSVVELGEWDCAVVEQWNHERLKVKDEMLEERGWLAKPKTTMRHANDAARHVLKFKLKQEKNA